MARLYANNYSTTLNGSITNVATSITVTSVTGLPAIGGGDTCNLTIDDGTNIEIVTATAVAGFVLTVTRGVEGTSGTAFADAVTIELRSTADSYDDITDSSRNIKTTGTVDLGEATSLEVPNSATPTVNADGEIALDTTVADFSHGVMKYYGGEELGFVAMPIAQFTTPADGVAVTYNATNDEFEVTDSFLKNTGDVGTGAYDFGGADSLEVPNSATPTVSVDGQIALDTTVTDFSHGILKYYGGEEMGVIAMPIAQFTAPTDGHVIAYNATNDEFELVAGGGGGGTPGGADTNVQFNNAGAFGGDANFTYDGSGTATLKTGLNVGGNATAAGTIKVYEDSDNGSNYVNINAPVGLSGNVDFELPNADAAAFDFLIDDGTRCKWAKVTDITNNASPSVTDSFLTYATGLGVNRAVQFQDFPKATTSVKGIASFDSGDFSVTAGAVSLASSPGLTFISSVTASASATVEFTSGIDSTYDSYLLYGEGLAPATDAVQFLMRTSTDGGSTYASTSGDYQYAGASSGKSGPLVGTSGGTTATDIFFTNNVGNAAGENISFTLEMFKPSAAAPCQFMIKTTALNSSGDLVFQNISAARAASADVDAIQFFFSSGNIASGTIRMYGVNKS